VSDLAALYIILVLIYAFECAAFVPRRAVGVARRFGRWTVQRALAPSAAWRSGFVLGEPWPPLSSALVAEPLPLVAGPDGISVEDGEFVPWEKVAQVAAEERRLVINGRTAAPLSTRLGARALAEAFDGLAALPRHERERRLKRWLDARFDDGAIETRLPVMARETRPARIAANVLWAAVFLGLPVLLWTPLAKMFLAVGAVAAAGWIAAAVLFEVALRRSRSLDRGLRPDLAKRIAAIASPMTTIRACDHFARELAGDLDPLAVAAPLVAAAELGVVGRARLVDLKFRPPGTDVPPAGQADLAWWKREMLTRIGRTLRAHDVDPDELLAEPARDGADVVGWCPICRQQYRGGADEAPRACANPACDDAELLAFVQPGSATPARNSPA
jgi:hypothetical protein